MRVTRLTKRLYAIIIISHLIFVKFDLRQFAAVLLRLSVNKPFEIITSLINVNPSWWFFLFFPKLELPIHTKVSITLKENRIGHRFHKLFSHLFFVFVFNRYVYLSSLIRGFGIYFFIFYNFLANADGPSKFRTITI